MSADRTTFRLPGHILNPSAERKCHLSLLAAYSKQWNPRNLEAPWYEPWSQIFADLVARHQSLSVAPQPYLWYDPTSHWQAHTVPDSDHLLSTEDEQLDEQLDDVGSTTLDSIRSISVPAHRNRSRIPDFAITRKVSFQRTENCSQILHLDRRVTCLGFPVLVELKASGARCRDICTSLSNATKPMDLARDQLFKQAHHLFQMYPHQESVILIAISGFWWSYSVHLRMPSAIFYPAEEEDDENEDDEMCLQGEMMSPSENGIHAILQENPLPSNEIPMEALQEQLYGFPLNTVEGIVAPSGERCHPVLPEGQVKLRGPEESWSDYLLYGSAASNQVFSLILDHLHSVVHVRYDGSMG